MYQAYLRTTILLLVCLMSWSTQASIIYSDRTNFESTLGNSITDDYSNPAYTQGDHRDSGNTDIFTDAAMSEVFGETIYMSTGLDDRHYVTGQRSGTFIYCSGCNGSFLLDFTSTSIGSAFGVFGVGLDVVGSQTVYGTAAFVTFGDGSTANYGIPDAIDDELPFWGITSNLLISTIHFGLPDGGIVSDNNIQRMALDNLTIGSAIEVPEPAVFWLMLLGLATYLMVKRQRH